MDSGDNPSTQAGGTATPTEQERLERELRELCARGEMAQAIEKALQAYGSGILGMMTTLLHDPDWARDAYGVFSENLVKGLPNFRWESSFRTWAYRLARNVCLHLLRSPTAREQSLSQASLSEIAQPHRSSTNPWQQTAVKQRFRSLRERLSAEDQRLLQLRLDQRMAWTDVARAMAGPDEVLTSAELNRRATALRQQIQRIKSNLRTLAIQEGLVMPQDALD